MRYLSIVFSALVLTILAVACDSGGDIPGRDIPRTVPPAHVGSPVFPNRAPLTRPSKRPVRGVGPILEAGVVPNAFRA